MEQVLNAVASPSFQPHKDNHWTDQHAQRLAHQSIFIRSPEQSETQAADWQLGGVSDAWPRTHAQVLAIDFCAAGLNARITQ